MDTIQQIIQVANTVSWPGAIVIASLVAAVTTVDVVFIKSV